VKAKKEKERQLFSSSNPSKRALLVFDECFEKRELLRTVIQDHRSQKSVALC
jgi:hypothetical protein